MFYTIFPDMEMVGMVAETGVLGKVDKLFESLCTVLCPHLVSLRNGEDEIDIDGNKLPNTNTRTSQMTKTTVHEV